MMLNPRQWLEPWLVRTREVPVERCVHYGAFRYGRGELNPYENYVTALAGGESVTSARERFVDFLRHYRPRNFGEALGVALTQEHALWDFPWVKPGSTAGWRETPGEVPDILTHFSPRGILRPRIDQEFAWLERAFASIREHGYHPKRFAGHIEAWLLVAEDGDSRYLITDGNHRLSALVALGHRTVTVRFRWRMTVRATGLSRWPRVASGAYSADDARKVLRAYFDGNRHARTTETPASIIDRDPVSEATR